MTTFTPTIGLEIHAELKTKSKMFCGCLNDPHDSEPNANVCPVCMAHPGTLPTVNKEAVKSILLIGEALGGEIATYSEFDRKNYFYPDIPKGYQISQYEFPFVKGGELAGVAITRIHLEEDTARSRHAEAANMTEASSISGNGSAVIGGVNDSESVVDFNRAGVPLMELVTEPVIHDAETAANFARELQLLLRTLGISDANMERGEMRVEANISISSTDTFGTKVEVKNLNSFRSVAAAIEYEISRQTEIINNNKVISPETRGWDEQKLQTFSQRTKETADDYRYFPDPDIPKFDLDMIRGELAVQMPELPQETRLFLRERGVPEERIELLLNEPAILSFFRAVVDVLERKDDIEALKTSVNYLTSDISGILQRESGRTLSNDNAKQFLSLVRMVTDQKITSRVAKDLLVEVVFEGADPERLAESRGLLQQNTEEDLKPVVEEIIASNPKVVEDYRNGKEASLQFLVGQGMKATKGSANPELLAKLLKEQLSE